VVHRDLKPSNLFLVPDHALPGGERLKVLDFGIAKLLDRRIGIDDLTKTGSTMGTPAFMAPEQGIDAKRVDHRADIYSLGVVAYYLLSERLPTTGEGMLQIYIKQASRPVRLSEAGLALPVAVEEAVMKCLEPTREERFQSMAELLEALPDEEEMRGWSETPAPSVKQLAPIAPAPHLPSSPAGLPTNAAWPPPGAEPIGPSPSPSPVAEGPTLLASSSAAAAPERPAPLPQVQNRDAVIVTEETVLLRSAEPAPPKAEPPSSSPTAALAELATVIERPSDAPSTHAERVTMVERPATSPAVRELADSETVIETDTVIETAPVTGAARSVTETLAQAETLIKVRAPDPAAWTPGRQQNAPKEGRGWLLLALLAVLAVLLVTAALVLARADQGSRTVIEAIDGG
jgi:serine/threonine protein kinase